MTDAAAPRPLSAVDRDARVLTAFFGAACRAGARRTARGARASGGGRHAAALPSRGPVTREAADELLELGARTDVYVGCAPRLRLAGDRGALGAAGVLWVDCDGPASVARLAQFVPAPAVVVRSGSATNVHAYWPLMRPLAPDEATAANRQLADLLAADARSADATRILRAPGTRNFKQDPPRAVVLERFNPAPRFTVAEVVGTTAMGASTPASASASAEATASVAGDEPLRRIPPGVYVHTHAARRWEVRARRRPQCRTTRAIRETAAVLTPGTDITEAGATYGGHVSATYHHTQQRTDHGPFVHDHAPGQGQGVRRHRHRAARRAPLAR